MPRCPLREEREALPRLYRIHEGRRPQYDKSYLEAETFSSRIEFARPHHRDQRIIRRTRRGLAQTRGHLGVEVVNKLLDLALHGFHLFAHVENNLYSREIDAQISGEF